MECVIGSSVVGDAGEGGSSLALKCYRGGGRWMRCTITSLLPVVESIITVPPVIAAGVPVILILMDIDLVEILELDGPIGPDVECPFVECNDRGGNGAASKGDAVEVESKLFTHYCVIVVIYY